MKLHPNARTTPHTRLVLVERLRSGVSLRAAAEAVGVSRSTAHKWWCRYQAEGEAGLQDRSSAPIHQPHRTPARLVERIERLRRKRLTGRAIARELRMAVSTVSRILRRLGLGRLRALQPKEPVHRYEWPRPGDLVHIDVKPLGRFHRPGHRVTGRSSGHARSRGARWEYAHVCVDDHSRVAYVEILPAQTGQACAGFLQRALRWFARRGVRVRRVMTDNAKAYTVAHAWRDVLLEHAIPRHITTRPYRPQTNGKAERFIQTLIREWAYGRRYRSSSQRARALPFWVKHYNHARPHGSLGDVSPVTRIPT